MAGRGGSRVAPAHQLLGGRQHQVLWRRALPPPPGGLQGDQALGRPRGREAVPMLDLPEVLPAEAEERGAIELGVAAHPVVGVRVQLSTLRVPPYFLGVVFPLEVDRLRTPVVLLAWDVVAALEEQDALTGGGETMRQRSTPRPGPDDDDVEVLDDCHKILPKLRGAEPTDQTSQRTSRASRLPLAAARSSGGTRNASTPKLRPASVNRKRTGNMISIV